MSKVNEKSTVVVHYTGKLEDGSIFDSSYMEGRNPLNVKLGEGALIPGFEKGLINMEVGQIKTIEIDPDDAYGQFNPEMLGEVTKDKVPNEIEVGHTLQTMTQQGPLNVRVVEIKEDTVLLDANHPLAGKKLLFELELISLS